MYDRAYTQDISEWFELQVSELAQDYFDKEELTVTANTANNSQSKLSVKTILTNIASNVGKSALNSLLGASEFTSSVNDLTERRRQIRE